MKVKAAWTSLSLRRILARTAGYQQRLTEERLLELSNLQFLLVNVPPVDKNRLLSRLLTDCTNKTGDQSMQSS